MFSLAVLMVEGLTCFIVDIRQNMRNPRRWFVSVDFLFYGGLFVVTYPPVPLFGELVILTILSGAYKVEPLSKHSAVQLKKG